MATHKQSIFYGFGLLLIISVFVAVPYLMKSDMSNVSNWWLGIVLMLMVFILVAGKGVTGVWRGAFINDLNRMSLSQIQLILWTILVLATYMTGAFANLTLGVSNPLEIKIEESIWMLMGISTTTLIGSPLLASRKKAQSKTDIEEALAMNKLADQGRDASKLDTEGRLLSNSNLSDAHWSDIFEAEEISRAGRLDMSKIQMFFFTLIVAIVYGSVLAGEMGPSLASCEPGVAKCLPKLAQGFHAFPALSESMVALLGISHAGYLASKAVPEREGV